MLLRDRVVVVTGGNSGIGAAICDVAGAEGAKVVVDYVVHPQDAQAVDDEVTREGSEAISVDADVSKVEDLHRLVEAAVTAYGRIDVWINNAGIETRTSLLDTDEDAYDRVLAINLKSAFFGSQLAAKQFIAQGSGGVIVNVSSVHEDWPMPGNTPYCVSKGGMRMLTRTAGVELGPHGIRVVGVGPGAVDTPINATTTADPTKLRALDAAIPLARLATPEEIANTVVFLASDRSGYATATTVFVDGGIMQGSVGL
ncbi:glucose 1-dehydrogenase [Terrabacter sp. NPDC080008]|uniref:SDR family NAD(P)-dependent oxidoreductase n=1 Tax=Terrabacter sp. NPDC080008 TaxID=3155176 RepID=UPI00344C5D7D